MDILTIVTFKGFIVKGNMILFLGIQGHISGTEDIPLMNTSLTVGLRSIPLTKNSYFFYPMNEGTFTAIASAKSTYNPMSEQIFLFFQLCPST